MERDSLVQPTRVLMFYETDPELLGQLQVPERPQACGGYADIYHGLWITPEGQQVEVAVKELKDLIPNDHQIDPAALIQRRDTRMRREVFVWRQMVHPNLHPLLGYRSQPKPRLISPWCRHGNLTHYLQRNPGLSRLDKLRLVFHAACGLEHLHAQVPPVCHADIKPENVLVNDRFLAALSDFGLSRVLDSFGHHGGFTTSDTAKGTYNYTAPELFNEEKLRPTLKTDVYAFGGLILTVMTGKAPFYDLRQPAILRRVIQNQPPRQEEHQELPSSDPLWDLMHRCWDMNPEARPPMQEVLRELWGDVCKEEVDFWSRLGLSPLSDNNNGTDSSHMDLDISGETATAEVFAVLNHGPVPGHNFMPPVNIAEKKPRHAVTEGVLSDARKLLKALKVNSGIIGRYIAAFGAVGSILLELAQTMERNDSVANSITSNALELIGRLELLQEESRTRQGEVLAARIVDVQRALRCILQTIEDWCSLGLFLDAFSCCDEAQGLKSCERVIKLVLEEIRLLVALEAADIVTRLSNTETEKEQRRLLDRLGDGSYGITGNTIEDVTCFPGTRVDILDMIDDWVRNLSGSERVLWVRGMAGRGKSTIASTVADRWKHRASCAIFHFRKGQEALNSRVVCALGRQLGSSLVSEVRCAVLESIRENEDIANEQLSEQFKTLLVASLGKLKKHPYPILIIVDALDECNNPKYVLDFVKLIHRHSSRFPANVKFLLTCRPEAALLRALEPSGCNAVDLDSAPDVSNDLARFIQHACGQVRDHHGLPDSWPSPEDLLHLVDMSQGLFQWARTTINYINDGSPADRLRRLVRHQALWGGLDALYHEILSRAMDNVRQDPEKQQLLCSVLGTLVVAPHPVSLEVIATLCDAGSDIFEGMEQENIIQFLRKDLLADLNSLLHIPASRGKSVRFMHTSVHDLLASKQRCQDKPYYIDTIQHHQRLAKLSLGFMLKTLKENICNLSDLSQASWEIQETTKRELSSALRYCCRSWAIHVTKGTWWSESNDVTRSQLAAFELFSKEKIMGWIEVMSLIGATSEGITMAKQVYDWLMGCNREIFGSDLFINLWNDVYRFIAAFLEPISFGPLHIYASALPYCPQKTELWRMYSCSAKVRVVRGRQMSKWPSDLWNRSAGGIPETVAFSPDGSLVISVSWEGPIRVWDLETGRGVSQMEANYDGIISTCVSPDGRITALGLRDNTIRLLDPRAEIQLGKPLTGHSGLVRVVCFSSDGRVLASGSDDRTIRLWDPQTGRQLGKPMTVHSGAFSSLSFSPDGRVLASGSSTWSRSFSEIAIILWDTWTGMQLGTPLTGHSESVKSVCFSPDGRVLASGSKDQTIRLWDPQTGRQLGTPLTGHSDQVESVCFSPDGRVLASGSQDETIRLWDPKTGRQLGEPLTDHSHSVIVVCFSPNGRYLASGSLENTVRLWDPQTGRQSGEPASGLSDTVQSALFSPEGGAMESESTDETNQLWNPQIRRELSEPQNGHRDVVWSVCFSPDGGVLASGSSDYTIRLWDVQNGVQLGTPMTGHCALVESVCFSSDGRILASGSWDGTIRLWDPQTGRQLGEPLNAGSKDVFSVCFSPDGRVLASGFRDGTIQLWDPQTRRQLGEPLTGHRDFVWCVCFSPDSRILASGSENTIRLWDSQTRRQLGKLMIGYGNSVVSVRFSPDGMFIVGHSREGYTIWHALTHEECHTPPLLPSHLTIGFRDRWLTLSSSPLLWLPAEYSDICSDLIALHNSTLAIANENSISIFDLSLLFRNFG